MARKPEIAELSTRLLMQTLGSDRRYKRIVVFGGIAVVVVGAAVYGVARTVDARDTAAREAAYGSLGVCLVGAEPLKDGEAPSARVANIKLGVVGVAPDKRGAKAGELAWPASCFTQAYALAEHAAGTPLGTAAEALAKALRADAAATGDEHAEIDKVWAEAAAAKVKAAPPADAVPAPKPAAPLFTADQFKALPKFLSGGFSLANVREEPDPGGKLYFLVDQKDTPEGPVLCTAVATDTTVKCIKVPEAVATLSPGLRLIGSTEDMARPFYFAGDRGQLGIFPPDAKNAVASGQTYGATARADGSIGLLMRKEGGKELHLLQQPAPGAPGGALPVDQTVLQPTDFDTPTQTGMFWDWIAYRSLGKLGAASHLFARKVEGPVVKPAVDVGEIEEIAPMDKAERDREQVAGCKSDDAIAVRVRGQKGDEVAFFAAGRWSAPVKSTTRGGAFTCHGLEAVSTVVEHSPDRDKDYPTITQSRCNTSGCTPVKVDVRQLLAGLEIAPSDAGGSVAADAGGKLLFVWNAGAVGGLRMRLGAPDRLKEAEDVIITDGRDEKTSAGVSSIASMRVLQTNTFALLFLGTTSGVKVLRVEPATGKLTPLQGTL
jgi:hypothetical protein